jgi:hypothetical protein
MRSLLKPALLGGIIVATAAGVVACGGGSGSSTTTTSAAASSSAAVSSSASGGRGARANPFADASVQACLKAAGIAVPTFAGRPSGSFTRPRGSFTRPSGSFTRPSGSFTRPSGVGGGGGFFGTDSAEGAQIQAALKACGITLPTGGGRGTGGAPTSAPTS